VTNPARIEKRPPIWKPHQRGIYDVVATRWCKTMAIAD
jgi:hypothetical protein